MVTCQQLQYNEDGSRTKGIMQTHTFTYNKIRDKKLLSILITDQIINRWPTESDDHCAHVVKRRNEINLSCIREQEHRVISSELSHHQGLTGDNMPSYTVYIYTVCNFIHSFDILHPKHYTTNQVSGSLFKADVFKVRVHAKAFRLAAKVKKMSFQINLWASWELDCAGWAVWRHFMLLLLFSFHLKRT